MGAVRKDVRDGSQAETARGGLVYTKKAGWVDLGHARPDNARQFWKQFQCEPRSHEWPNNDHSYVVEFGEQMFAMNLIGVREYDRYRVQRGLSLKQKKSVAMAIYFEISIRFERLQGKFPLEKTRDSSFSGEDLVSNLIGFYRAVEPGKKYVEMCEPVPLKEALTIWDRFGPIGHYKNHKIRPLLFHLGTDQPVLGQLPLFLRTIQPAKKDDVLYSEFIKSLSK